MTRETPQHYIKIDLRQQHMTTQHDSNTTWQQHGCNTTWLQHNMVAAQNMVQTLLGRQQHKGQKGRDNNTSHEAATSAGKIVHDWFFQWRYGDKTVRFECFLQPVPVASYSELKRGATQGYVCFGDHEQNVTGRCCMWRMRAAVDISDRGSEA